MQTTASNDLSAQQLPAQTVPQPPQLVQTAARPAQPVQTAARPAQPAQTVAQPPQPVQTAAQPPQTAMFSPIQPPQAAPQPLQTLAHPTPPVDNTSLPSFVQFTMPQNVFPQPVLNNPLQTPLQHTVPSSLAVPHASTLSFLNALNDDKLGLILPMLVRMEHKIDQLMATMGAKPGPAVGNHLDAAPRGNHSSTQKNTGGKAATSAAHAQPIKSPASSIQTNARLAVAQLFDSSVENEEDESESESSADKIFNPTKSLPGMTSRQRIQLEMAKITEKTLPDDLNFPISREDLITLQARSTSTMNFAVRLLRELFTRDELIGRNISGVRGKERVDPARIEIIKEIVFKIYRTSPSDRELLWRYCRKAMDSFLRKMQRPIEVVKDQYDPPSFAASDQESAS